MSLPHRDIWIKFFDDCGKNGAGGMPDYTQLRKYLQDVADASGIKTPINKGIFDGVQTAAATVFKSRKRSPPRGNSPGPSGSNPKIRKLDTNIANLFGHK